MKQAARCIHPREPDDWAPILERDIENVLGHVRRTRRNSRGLVSLPRHCSFPDGIETAGYFSIKPILDHFKRSLYSHIFSM